MWIPRRLLVGGWILLFVLQGALQYHTSESALWEVWELIRVHFFPVKCLKSQRFSAPHDDSTDQKTLLPVVHFLPFLRFPLLGDNPAAFSPQPC